MSSAVINIFQILWVTPPTGYKDTPSYRVFNFVTMQHTKDTFPFIFQFLSFIYVHSIATRMLFTKQVRKAINNLI